MTNPVETVAIDEMTKLSLLKLGYEISPALMSNLVNDLVQTTITCKNYETECQKLRQQSSTVPSSKAPQPQQPHLEKENRRLHKEIIKLKDELDKITKETEKILRNNNDKLREYEFINSQLMKQLTESRNRTDKIKLYNSEKTNLKTEFELLQKIEFDGEAKLDDMNGVIFPSEDVSVIRLLENKNKELQKTVDELEFMNRNYVSEIELLKQQIITREEELILPNFAEAPTAENQERIIKLEEQVYYLNGLVVEKKEELDKIKLNNDKICNSLEEKLRQRDLELEKLLKKNSDLCKDLEKLEKMVEEFGNIEKKPPLVNVRKVITKDVEKSTLKKKSTTSTDAEVTALKVKNANLSTSLRLARTEILELKRLLDDYKPKSKASSAEYKSISARGNESEAAALVKELNQSIKKENEELKAQVLRLSESQKDLVDPLKHKNIMAQLENLQSEYKDLELLHQEAQQKIRDLEAQCEVIREKQVVEDVTLISNSIEVADEPGLNHHSTPFENSINLILKETDLGPELHFNIKDEDVDPLDKPLQTSQELLKDELSRKIFRKETDNENKELFELKEHCTRIEKELQEKEALIDQLNLIIKDSESKATEQRNNDNQHVDEVVKRLDEQCAKLEKELHDKESLIENLQSALKDNLKINGENEERKKNESEKALPLEISDLMSRIESLEMEKTILEDSKQQAILNLEILKKDLKDKISEFDRERDELQRQLDEKCEFIDNLIKNASLVSETEKKLNEVDIEKESLKRNLNQIQNEFRAVENLLLKKEEEMNQLMYAFEERNSSKLFLEGELKTATATQNVLKLRIEELNEDLCSKSAELNDKNVLIEDLKLDCVKKDQELTVLRYSLQQLQENANRKVEESVALLKETGKLKIEYEELKKTIYIKEEEISRLGQQIGDLKDQLEFQKFELSRKDETITFANNQLEILENCLNDERSKGMTAQIELMQVFGKEKKNVDTSIGGLVEFANVGIDPERITMHSQYTSTDANLDKSSSAKNFKTIASSTDPVENLKFEKGSRPNKADGEVQTDNASTLRKDIQSYKISDTIEDSVPFWNSENVNSVEKKSQMQLTDNIKGFNNLHQEDDSLFNFSKPVTRTQTNITLQSRNDSNNLYRDKQLDHFLDRISQDREVQESPSERSKQNSVSYSSNNSRLQNDQMQKEFLTAYRNLNESNKSDQGPFVQTPEVHKKIAYGSVEDLEPSVLSKGIKKDYVSDQTNKRESVQTEKVTNPGSRQSSRSVDLYQKNEDKAAGFPSYTNPPEYSSNDGSDGKASNRQSEEKFISTSEPPLRFETTTSATDQHTKFKISSGLRGSETQSETFFIPSSLHTDLDLPRKSAASAETYQDLAKVTSGPVNPYFKEILQKSQGRTPEKENQSPTSSASKSERKVLNELENTKQQLIQFEQLISEKTRNLIDQSVKGSEERKQDDIAKELLKSWKTQNEAMRKEIAEILNNNLHSPSVSDSSSFKFMRDYFEARSRSSDDNKSKVKEDKDELSYDAKYFGDESELDSTAKSSIKSKESKIETSYVEKSKVSPERSGGSFFNFYITPQKEQEERNAKSTEKIQRDFRRSLDESERRRKQLEEENRKIMCVVKQVAEDLKLAKVISPVASVKSD